MTSQHNEHETAGDLSDLVKQDLVKQQESGSNKEEKLTSTLKCVHLEGQDGRT